MAHPTGEYEATILDHGFCLSRGHDPKDQFWALFLTVEGKIAGYFYMTDGAIEHTLSKIAAMGFDGSDLGQLEDGTALADNKCRITVEHEEYNGKTYAKVAFVSHINAKPWAPERDRGVVTSVRRKFNAMLSKSASKTSQPAKPSNAPQKRATQSMRDDDQPNYDTSQTW